MGGVEWVTPGVLRLPPSRPSVDMFKLAGQYRQFGTEVDGMPPIEVTRCAAGELLINSGVTRATRAHRYGGPGVRVPVTVIEERPKLDVTGLPRISDAG
jgi:hypothetical protein